MSQVAALILVAEFLASAVAWGLVEYLTHRSSHAVKEKNHERHHQGLRDKRKFPAIAVLVLAAGLAWSAGNLHVEAIVAGLLYRFGIFTVCHELSHKHGLKLPRHLRTLRERHLLHHRNAAGNFGTSTRYWDRLFRTELSA